MKGMKFRVRSKQHSKAIQKRLIELGFVWWGSKSAEVKHTGELYLYADSDMTITHSSNSNRFLKQDNIETTLDELYEMKTFVTVQLNDEYTATLNSDGTVTVGCSEFSKDAIEKFIKAYKNQ